MRTESSNTSLNSGIVNQNSTSRRLSKQVDAPIIKVNVVSYKRIFRTRKLLSGLWGISGEFRGQSREALLDTHFIIRSLECYLCPVLMDTVIYNINKMLEAYNFI